ncbi:hypothetical protein [Nonomuraea salmonea]|uniref:hypothetical protein n=1 Tax=Nonomuraea salmonea TaxID=46181 RepID=UPI0031E8DBEB
MFVRRGAAGPGRPARPGDHAEGGQARDIEAMRAALGEERLSFLATSYGGVPRRGHVDLLRGHGRPRKAGARLGDRPLRRPRARALPDGGTRARTRT